MPFEESNIILTIVREERDLFDLNNREFRVFYASGELLEEMEKEGEICEVQSKPESIDFYFNRSYIMLPHGLNEDLIRMIADYGWAYANLSPYSEYRKGRFRTGMELGEFRTGMELEETQAMHIAYACEMLRKDDDFEFKVRQPDNLREIIKKAYKLLRLDKNNWRIYPRVLSRVEFGGVRLPAFAYSTFYENYSHLGLMSAREIMLDLDLVYANQLGLEIKDLILKELWRVVLNPYGEPFRSPLTERKLYHIMHAMKELGW